MPEHTPYQQSIIRNYYRNLDAVLLQRLGEQVSDLYLAQGKARTRLWERIRQNLLKLGVPESRVAHVVASDNPELLARLLKELMS
ncbi:MAG: hypothetical protein K6T86_13730 [Pirellulales bacterium]|jgi:hypothetical protein|nr:hypothetical protein [Pirellulales bacterium]